MNSSGHNDPRPDHLIDGQTAPDVEGLSDASQSVESAPNVDPELAIEHEKVIQDGRRLFAEGRSDEAAMIAQSVLVIEPENLLAMGLYADCLEQRGRVEEAAEMYRKILELKPDSRLDEIRLGQLERKLENKSEEGGIDPVKRRNALIAACLAAVVVIASASALILASRPSDRDLTVMNDPVPSSQGFVPVAPIPTAQDPVGDGASGAAPASGSAEGSQSGSNARTGFSAPYVSMPPGGVRIPGASNQMSGQVMPGGFAEPYGGGVGFEPLDPGNIQVRPEGGQQRDPDPTEVQQPAETNRRDDPGVIVIRPSDQQPTRPTGGGSETVQSGGNEAESLIRVARQHYLAGNYAQAAATYEQALRAGASAGSTNQRLAQCYEKLGRRADAIAAYRRAIAAYEAVGGDRARASAEACRQAIAVLGG